MREMKNSGIEWIGDIPSEWKISKVGYFFDIQLGKMLQPTQQDKKDTLEDYFCAINFGGNKYKPLPIKQMWFNSVEKTLLQAKEGDLFVVEGGDVASCDIAKGIKENIYFQNALHRVRAKKDYDIRILKYWLWTAKALGHIDLICNKATIAHFSKEKFVSLPFIYIKCSEQKKIADFLDEKCAEIDTVIEKTKATIEEYKKLKQSVITQAVTKGIRPNRTMKDSGIEWIGEIPADWSVRKLKTFTTQISKGATPKDMSTEKTDFYSIRFLKSENIVDNQLMSVPEFYIEESIHSGELKRSQLSDNDIMFVIAGASIGKVAIVSNELLPANTNQAMSFIRVLEKYKEIKKYLWYVLQSDIMKLFITLYSVQSAQPNISMENLGNFRLCVPADFQEIKDILLYLNIKCLEIDELIAKKTSLLSELESYKKSLIYEYVTGKKEV